MRRALAFGLVVTLGAGCGAKVTVDQGSGGAASTGTSTGTVNAGGSTSTGTGPQICGGKQGLQCGPTQWCKWDQPGSCGNFDGAGTCQPRPQGCTADCPGVCGCDQQFYCNACGAEASGIDVSNQGLCSVVIDAGGFPELAAYQLATNVPRYAIAMTEAAANRCTWLVVAADGGAGFAIQSTMGWNVEAAFVTNQATDCKGPPGNFPMPAGTVAKADSGTGSLKQDSASFPCFVSVHVTLKLTPFDTWVPPVQSIDADQLLIQGGGCGGG